MTWFFQPKPENDNVCVTCRKKIYPQKERTYIVANKAGEYCRQCDVCWDQHVVIQK